MYRIWAKLFLNPEKHDAKGLVQAFFGRIDFNSQNSLVIRGEEAKVEIVFEELPPMEIIEAISNCKIMELNFGKELEEYNGESKSEAEPAKVEEEEVPQPEAEPAKVEEEEVPQPEAEPAKVEEKEVPQLEAESAEVEEEEVPQPEAEPEEGEEKETPQPETEPAEAEEEETPQPETEWEEEEEEEAPRHQPKTKKKGRPKVVGPETVNIPYLKELAEKATSFEHFVKLVAEWLEMGKYQEFFENLEIAATQVSKMSWSELKKALARNKVYYTESTKIRTVKHVSEKIEKYNTTLLPFLGAIALYQNYSFASEEVKMDVWPKDEKKEEHSDEDENSTSVKVKMQCIPEIRSFEETLSSVDKTQPIEERVKHVLTAMGWEKKENKEKALILAIVRGAITVKEMNFDNIFQKAGIPVSDNFMARMHLAKLINDFVKMHYPSHKMVNVLDFLKELQKIVVLESEIE